MNKIFVYSWQKNKVMKINFNSVKSDAVLAASVFHFGEIEIKDLKVVLKNNNILVRL
ncbi:hypothetical protein ACS386_13985 [Flavobacteriaceae bacterium LMO-SS05]